MRPTSWAGTRVFTLSQTLLWLTRTTDAAPINRRCAGRTTVATILPGEVARVAADDGSERQCTALVAGCRPALASSDAGSMSLQVWRGQKQWVPVAPRGAASPNSGAGIRARHPAFGRRLSAALSTARFRERSDELATGSDGFANDDSKDATGHGVGSSLSLGAGYLAQPEPKEVDVIYGEARATQKLNINPVLVENASLLWIGDTSDRNGLAPG